MKIIDTIFRAYDIRGIYGEEITKETAFTIGKSFGSFIQKTGKKDVLVGHDNRLSSPELSDFLIKGLLKSGVNVIDLGKVTTPMFYYARTLLNKWSGIMITASHNPSNYNGFKISFDEKGNAAGEEITEFKKFTDEESFLSGVGSYSHYSIKKEYIDLLVNSLRIGKKNIKVVVDCGNGTCSLVIKEILDKLDVTYDLLYCKSDGNFPNHHPDPSISENLVDLQKRVLELGYDLGIAVDADGDRVRLVDNNGEIINTDIFMIVMYRYLNNNLSVRKGLFDVKCSKALIDCLDQLGLEKIMYRTGNSYMFRKIRELNLDFAGEYSGHIWFGDRFEAFDDGIYAGLRMIEVLSNETKTLSELCNNVNKYYSTDEIKIEVSEIGKIEVVNKIKKYAKKNEYNFNDIDGVRVEFEDGWALIRYSNTGPNITVRFEANSFKRLEEIKSEFMTQIFNFIKEELSN